MQTNKKRLPANERRRITVQTMIELAAEQNPSNITTAAIAKQMGVTQGTLFRHFPDKDAIWQASVESVSTQLLARVMDASEQTETPLAALEAIFMAHIDYFACYPGIPSLILSELQCTEETPVRRILGKMFQHYIALITGLMDKGKLAGEIESSLDTSVASSLFLGAIQGLVIQSRLNGDIRSIRDKAPGVFAIYRRGIENR